MDISAQTLAALNLPPNALESSASNTTNNLIEDFVALVARNGVEGVSAAGAAVVVREFGEELKTLIQNDASIPRALKQDLLGFIDTAIGEARDNAPHACRCAMEGTTAEAELGQYGRLFARGLAEAADRGLGGDAANEYALEFVEEAMNEGRGGTGENGGGSGGGSSVPSGTPSAGGSSGAGGGGGGDIDLVGEFAEQENERSEENRNAENGTSRSGGRNGARGTGGGGGNWLLQLARGLADLQDTFLTKAIDNLNTMVDNADYEATGDGEVDQEKKKEFLRAQAEYQASMQMFNMMANMTATSLKSIGEGLTAIARKQ